MAYKQKLDELMDREMDRLEFLRYSAMLLVGIVGISRVLDTLHGAPQARSGNGYGSGTYGGANDSLASNAQPYAPTQFPTQK